MIDEKYIEKLNSFLKDDFEKNLFLAARKNLEADYHSLTFNNFAYAMRELIRHLLHRSAPDEEVLKCSWYKYDSTSKSEITRKQRLQYMIHGGLGVYLLKKLDLVQVINDACDNLLSQIKILNSYTHIGPKTFAIPLEKSKKLAQECISAVIEIISIIDLTKYAVYQKIENTLDDSLIKSTIFESFPEIEHLARRTSVEQLYAEGFKEIEILCDRVMFTVVGAAACYFEYGSRQEWRDGDGTIIRPSFPFSARITVMIENPFGEILTVDEIGINTDSWYE